MTDAMPRELKPGIFWLGGCLEQEHFGKTYHSYNAAFLIAGEEASLLVDTGHPKDFPLVERQLTSLLKTRAPLRYLFLTHEETPHSGGLGRVLKRFPDVRIYGDVSDYHLAFPQYAHVMHAMQQGDRIDLGNRTFRAVEPVIRDLRTTLWGFDEMERVLFPADGFAYSHYHEDRHCGLFAEEAESLDLRDVTAVFAERALFWTKFTNMRPYVERLYALLEELDVTMVAPSHGLPIADLKRTMPRIVDGLMYGSELLKTAETEILFADD